MAALHPVDSTQRRRWHLPRSNALIGLTAAVSLLHHVDHVLRVDHSGWPFIPQVTPFTFTLIIYPLYFVVFRMRRGSWARVYLFGLIYLAVQAAHIVVEPPADQFHTWAYSSRHSWAQNTPTLVIQQSALLGTLSVVVSLLVSVIMIATLISLVCVLASV